MLITQAKKLLNTVTIDDFKQVTFVVFNGEIILLLLLFSFCNKCLDTYYVYIEEVKSY